jgi:hypothetical protein
MQSHKEYRGVLPIRLFQDAPISYSLITTCRVHLMLSTLSLVLSVKAQNPSVFRARAERPQLILPGNIFEQLMMLH